MNLKEKFEISDAQKLAIKHNLKMVAATVAVGIVSNVIIDAGTKLVEDKFFNKNEESEEIEAQAQTNIGTPNTGTYIFSKEI